MMIMKVIGIDEAGRGSVIGPLVIGAVSTNDIPLLRSLGVKDSKLLTPARRADIFRSMTLTDIKIKYIAIPPSTIDRYVLYGKKHRRLNFLEARYMAKLVNSLEGELAMVDAADTDAELFSDQIKDELNRDIMLVSSHHADLLFPPVSAASIVAKVNRDMIVEGLKRAYGDFGSGYPSDPKTRSYLRKHIADDTLPPIVRRSWKTLKILNISQD